MLQTRWLPKLLHVVVQFCPAFTGSATTRLAANIAAITRNLISNTPCPAHQRGGGQPLADTAREAVFRRQFLGLRGSSIIRLNISLICAAIGVLLQP